MSVGVKVNLDKRLRGLGKELAKNNNYRDIGDTAVKGIKDSVWPKSSAWTR